MISPPYTPKEQWMLKDRVKVRHRSTGSEFWCLRWLVQEYYDNQMYDETDQIDISNDNEVIFFSLAEFNILKRQEGIVRSMERMFQDAVLIGKYKAKDI